MGRLQTARLENFIRRWGSIKGPGSVLSETLGDVFPTLDLENLTPENQLPAGWTLIAGGSTATGGVAQNGGVQLFNLDASGLLLVVDKIVIHSTTGQDVSYGTINGRMGGAGAFPRRRDARLGSGVTGLVDIRTATNAATEFFEHLTIAASVDREITVPNGIAVLPPNTGLSVVTLTNNTFLRVFFFARVRTAEPSELSF